MLLIALQCKKEDTIPPILVTQYDIEALFFKDTTLVYDFNGDQIEDFTIQLTWEIDTSGLEIFETFNMYFNNPDLEHALSLYNYTEKRDWAEGDTILYTDPIGWKDKNVGKGFTAVGRIDDFYMQLDNIKNHDVYMAYYLESGGKKHYGWIRLNCDLIAEVAFDLNPDEPVYIGQRE